jgi:hypothetical protein
MEYRIRNTETHVHKMTNVGICFLYGAGRNDFDVGKSITRAKIKSLRLAPYKQQVRYINSDRSFGTRNCIAFILRPARPDRDPVPPTQMIGSSEF